MRLITIVGILLILVGLVSLLSGGLTYTKDRDTTEIGPIDITVEERETVRIPTAVGIAALVGGVVLLVAGTRRRGV